jgi:beta-glucosidase
MKKDFMKKTLLSGVVYAAASLGVLLLLGCDANQDQNEQSGAQLDASEQSSRKVLAENSVIEQIQISTRTIELLNVDGLQFRDLNKNQSLDAYEDWRLSPEERAQDLLSKMTLEEKAGQIAHGNIFPGGPDTYGFDYIGYSMNVHKVTAYIPFVSMDYLTVTAQNNRVQEMAEAGRLGIPATISTDPKHHFMALVGASTAGQGYSSWPEPLGFAALNDAELTEKFAAIAAKEYRATGFNQALSPQADLVTEPRWARIYHSFGADPQVASDMVAAYIRGFQGSNEGVQRGKVSSIVKHWVGYGAAKDGWDSHNYYGRFADLDEQDLPLHIKPFEGAFSANVSGVMPAYSVFEGLSVNGQPVEQMGAAYSKVMVNDLLREQYNYQGVVLSDWAIINDCSEVCKNGAAAGEQPNEQTDISTGWGVQHLSKAERFALAMKVGVDQFGGVNDVAPLLEAVSKGLISEARIDQSVLRILKKTFSSGLFESPFADIEDAKSLVNTPEAKALGLKTQSRSMVLLKADKESGWLGNIDQKIYLHGASATVFEADGYTVVTDISAADTAVVRLHAPYEEELNANYFFGREQHEGSLDFDPDGEAMKLLAELKSAGVRVIIDVALDRPAILTQIVEYADLLVVNFGASDQALLRVLNGTVAPEGRLPFELPSSMAAVEAQNSGKPADSEAPLFPLHFSLRNGH